MIATRLSFEEFTMDNISKVDRSALMSRIRSKDTKPERAVRSILHHLGFRFRIHRNDLPGKPDVVLPRHRKIILVHGCFWHGHFCALASKPKSNQDYWREKIKTNRLRDRRVKRDLVKQGWSVLELWECEIRKETGLPDKLKAFMCS
jgi:DNA mismatch endonuclease (patch repair protein)